MRFIRYKFLVSLKVLVLFLTISFSQQGQKGFILQVYQQQQQNCINCYHPFKAIQQIVSKYHLENKIKTKQNTCSKSDEICKNLMLPYIKFQINGQLISSFSGFSTKNHYEKWIWNCIQQYEPDFQSQKVGQYQVQTVNNVKNFIQFHLLKNILIKQKPEIIYLNERLEQRIQDESDKRKHQSDKLQVLVYPSSQQNINFPNGQVREKSFPKTIQQEQPFNLLDKGSQKANQMTINRQNIVNNSWNVEPSQNKHYLLSKNLYTICFIILALVVGLWKFLRPKQTVNHGIILRTQQIEQIQLVQFQ